MDVANIIAGVRQGLQTVQTLAAAFGVDQGALGGAAKLISLGSAVADVAQDLLQLAEDGQVALTSDDKAEVQTILRELQERNDQLNAAVLAS